MVETLFKLAANLPHEPYSIPETRIGQMSRVLGIYQNLAKAACFSLQEQSR